MKHNLVNMAWMQALWFAAVVGAAHAKTWPSVLILLLFSAWQLHPSHQCKGDVRLVIIALASGLVLDTLWMQLGWLDYQESWPISGLAPLWILALWAGLALTINHSLAWLQQRMLLAAVASGFSSVVSYLAAQRFGALAVIAEPTMVYVAIFSAWAVTLSMLLKLASHFRRQYEEVHS